MDRYKRHTINECFVYSYNMPKEIDLNEKKPIKKKRKVVNIFFKKGNNKNSAVVCFGDDKAPKAQRVNDKNQVMTLFTKRSSKIKLHDKRNKLNMNCCRVS